MRRLLAVSFLLLDAALLITFLVGYAARYISPWRFWWAELFAIGLPYVSLLLVAVLLGLLLARRWKLAAAHAVLVGLALVRFAPIPPAFLREAGPEDLVVMTLNLPSSHAVGIPSALHEARLRALLSQAQPDLAAFQEASHLHYLLEDGQVRLAAPEGGSRIYHFAGLSNGEAPGMGRDEPVLARTETGAVQAIKLLEDPDSEAYAVRTEFEWQGRRAAHYNVHLESFQVPHDYPASVSALSPRLWVERVVSSKESVRTRAQEAMAIRRLIAQEELPVILTGDFNSTAHSWAFRQIASGLTDAFRVAGEGWGATWHARVPFARIDFVLAGPAWEVVAADVADVQVSDHRPLIVRLRWHDQF